MNRRWNRCTDVCADCEVRAQVELCMHGCAIYMNGLMGRNMMPMVKGLGVIARQNRSS